MIRNINFTHVPNAEPRISLQDPRQRNHRDNAQTRHNMDHRATRIITELPSFSLYN